MFYSGGISVFAPTNRSIYISLLGENVWSSWRVGSFGLGFALVYVGVWAPTALAIGANWLLVVCHIEIAFECATDDIGFAQGGIGGEFTYHVVGFLVEHNI